MNFCSNFEPTPPTDVEKNLAGAMHEGAWDSAVELVRRIEGFSLRRAAETGTLATAFARFVTDAPDTIVTKFRDAARLDEFSSHHVNRYRRSALMLVSEAHLELALQYGDTHRLGAAHYHTAAAIDVLPRCKEHETILAGGIAHFIRIVGQCESLLGTNHPGLELDPKAVAPHPSVVRAMVDCDGYDPRAGADLLRRAGNACCSPGLIATALQFAFADAHWPTWRALLVLSAGEPERLKPAAEQLRTENHAFTKGALDHLAALLSGYRPVHDCIVPDTGDDVSF